MARTPKPWFREDRQSWFVTIDGERINLGPDEDEAKRQFHTLMARPPKPRSAAKSPSGGLTVADIFEKYLEWCSKNRSAGTYQWFKSRIQYFINAVEHAAGLPALELKPFHIIEWTDQHAGWSPTYRRGIISSIQRPYAWAVKLGYLASSPIRDIEKPAAGRREEFITPEEWPAIRDRYPENDPFRDLLEFSWETGARPFEVKRIEARHLQAANQRVVFPKEEAKGRKRVRAIYMTPRAEAIIVRLVAAHPEGPVFLNAKNRQWTNFAINCRFCRLEKWVGKKYCAYGIRHAFANRKLEDGLDHLTVAALMGHADGTMLARVYSHLADRQDHLREQLNKQPSTNVQVTKG